MQAMKRLRRVAVLAVAALTALAALAPTPVAAGSAAQSAMTIKPVIADDTGTPTPIRYRRGYAYGGLGFALGLAAAGAFAPRYYGYRYYEPTYYYGPPRRHCWWSHRYGGWVCRRHYY
jgi:hypothetical protein